MSKKCYFTSLTMIVLLEKEVSSAERAGPGPLAVVGEVWGDSSVAGEVSVGRTVHKAKKIKMY